MERAVLDAGAMTSAPSHDLGPRFIRSMTPAALAPWGDETRDATSMARNRDPLALPSVLVIASRYEILGLLGSGGMGTVYRARDRELDEIVALKTLRRPIAAAPGVLERFRREVKLARRVTHRNVARTFDIGEHAGAKFLTMEFIAGEMLGAILKRRGRLRLGEVIRIGEDLCAGLAAAHAANVLHRDLKPANVIVAPDGRAVITDFGIARALRAGESARSAGGVVGTPAYMAPEQLEGTADLDARADVYALGVMLFELLTGEVPWSNDSPIQAAVRRLREPPPDVRTLRPSLSEAAADLLQKCMATRRDDRFASADDVARALGQLIASDSAPSTTPPSASRRPSAFARTKVAVLPIRNLDDRRFDHLVDSLTENLGDVLGSVPELQIRLQLDVMGGSDAPRDPLAVGRACGVDAVIDGELRRLDEHVELSLRLSTCDDGFTLWQGRFRRSPPSIVEIADAAARAIAEALVTRPPAPPRPAPTNPLAHDLYLRGRHIYRRGWYDPTEEAARLLGEAHLLSPRDVTIAASYACALARGYGMRSRGEEIAEAAKNVAEKALAIEPRSPDAHIALGMVHFYRGDGIGAAAELRRAQAIGPDDPDVLMYLGLMRVEVGSLEQALSNTTAALAREPRLVEARHGMARAWALLGDRRRAMESLGPRPTEPNQLVPYLFARLRLGLWWGEVDGASELALELSTLRPRERRLAAVLLRAATRKVLDDADRATLERGFPSGYAMTQRLASFHAQIRAEAYFSCGENENGIEAVRDADANGLTDLRWFESCPVLDAIRGERRLEPIHRSIAVRAKRVSEVLNAP
jgi:serine/threonine-protein kinase